MTILQKAHADIAKHFCKGIFVASMSKEDSLIDLDRSCTGANPQVRQRRWRKEACRFVIKTVSKINTYMSNLC